MGGNLFLNTVAINKSYVKSTVESFFNEHLLALGVPRYGYIGSTGKSSVSGDIDLCISCSPQNKTILAKLLKKRMGETNVKVSGQNIAVKYKVAGFSDNFVQIDLMLAEKDKLDDVMWLMSGDGDNGVKGLYRNLMLCHIAKKISNKMKHDEKVTISFPGGLQYKKLVGKKWVCTNKKITKPQQILEALMITEKPENIVTFTRFVDFMVEDEVLNNYLNDFQDYINNYITNDPENANRALWYIKTKKRLKNEREAA